MKLNINFAYIIIFLRNGGERVRAIWLAKTILEISLQEASEWVDSVRLIKPPNQTLMPTIPPMEHQPTKIVSHWPPSIQDQLDSLTQGYRPSNSEGLQE